MGDFDELDTLKSNADINGAKIRKILSENPDLPVVFMADEDSVGDCGWCLTVCDRVLAHVKDITICNGKWYDDIGDLREDVEERLLVCGVSDAELDAEVQKRLDGIRWMKAVVIRVTN